MTQLEKMEYMLEVFYPDKNTHGNGVYCVFCSQ